MSTDVLSRLIDALRCLPGVGPKSAQRMVFHLLQHQRDRGLHLASCLQDAMLHLQHCQRCNNYTSNELCHICLSNERNLNILCIVEHPTDVVAIEQSNSYRGSYFVLMGKISPLDGLGPEEIGLPKLQKLVMEEQIQEIILALSPSIETQTTIHFIQELIGSHVQHISQLAHGIPSGAELEFLDSNTISSALHNRQTYNLNPSS